MMIDQIIVGQPMPAEIPDFGIDNQGVNLLFLSEGIIIKERLGFSYIPYVPCNVNCLYIKESETPEIISSKFTGCLMVAWEDENGLYVGHVHAGGQYDCKGIWREKAANSYRSFQFRPSDAIPTPSENLKMPSCYGFIEFDDTSDIIAAFSVLADMNNMVTVKKMMFKGHFTGHIEI